MGPDALLFHRMKRGETEAVDQFVEKYYPLVLQFFLPFSVSCCICFRTLYSRLPESLSLLLCGVWTVLWMELAGWDTLYRLLTPSLWGGLLGLNGAGKTTLMRLLCTLLRPTSGQICWNGQDIFALDREYRRILGYLPQEFGFYPEFTVQDYLLYTASLKGLHPADARRRSGALLEQVGLAAVRKEKMKRLSGGLGGKLSAAIPSGQPPHHRRWDRTAYPLADAAGTGGGPGPGHPGGCIPIPFRRKDR